MIMIHDFVARLVVIVFLEVRLRPCKQCWRQSYSRDRHRIERCRYRQTPASYYRHSTVGIDLYAVTLAVPIITDLASFSKSCVLRESTHVFQFSIVSHVLIIITTDKSSSLMRFSAPTKPGYCIACDLSFINMGSTSL